LNRIYRHKDYVTDVLSFEEDRKTTEIGEIIVCVSQAKRQAQTFSHSLEKEILRLVLHGYLHLSGYDHVKNKEALVMEALEEKILQKYYA